jgi:hypothetical protein
MGEGSAVVVTRETEVVVRISAGCALPGVRISVGMWTVREVEQEGVASIPVAAGAASEEALEQLGAHASAPARLEEKGQAARRAPKQATAAAGRPCDREPSRREEPARELGTSAREAE